MRWPKKYLRGRGSPNTQFSTPRTYADYPPLAEPNRNIASRSHVSPTELGVSIVIVNWNRSDLTVRCIGSILRAKTTFQNFEIILLDNGSSGRDFASLIEVAPFVRILRSPINLHFGEGNNVAAEVSSGEILILLNNDTEVADSWIDHLVQPLLNLQNCGAVGAHLASPSGVTQEVGCFINPDGTISQIGKVAEPPHGWMDGPQIVDYCSAACLAIRRTDFLALGGFDPIFEPAYYEDVDLCLRLRTELEKMTYVQPLCEILHHESATMGSVGLRNGMRWSSDYCRSTFRTRWNLWRGYRPLGTDKSQALIHRSDEAPKRKIYINAQLPGTRSDEPVQSNDLPERQEAVTERMDSPRLATNQLRIVIETPFPLTHGGGEVYITSVASALQNLGNAVTLVTPARYSVGKLASLSQTLGVDLTHVNFQTTSHGLPNHDVYILMGNQALPWKPASASATGIYICQFPFPMTADDVTNRWDFLKSYKACVVYSEFAAVSLTTNLRRMTTDIPPVKVIYPAVTFSENENIVDPKPATNFTEAPIILSVGRFSQLGHKKNQERLIEAFIQVASRYPKAILHLAGSAAQPDSILTLRNLTLLSRGYNVQFHPNCSNKDLHELYRRADWYWHAAGLDVNTATHPEKCEHFGIAPLEAMQNGCIVFVVNNGGPAEYTVHGKNGFLFSSVDELVRMSIEDVACLSPADISTLLLEARKTSSRYNFLQLGQQWALLLQELHTK